jgi:hypothetical protein
VSDLPLVLAGGEEFLVWRDGSAQPYESNSREQNIFQLPAQRSEEQQFPVQPGASAEPLSKRGS